MKTTTELQLVPISKLVPYVNNARTHSPEQIVKLRSSLREFGFINPVIIDRDYGVIAGHGRILAAKEEGITEVPCVFADHLTEAQKKAYIIADNRMAMDAGWDEELLRVEIEALQAADFDPLLTGFDEAELADLFSDGSDKDVKDDGYDLTAALEKASFVERGDVWTVGKHRLVCGDATNADDVALLMNGKRANLLLTDPPYGVSFKSSDGLTIQNDSLKNEEFYTFLLSAFKAAADHMEKGGAAYVFHADTEGLNFRRDLLDSEGRLLDNCLCVFFPGPDSYTGEDCAELHCHGSPVVLNEGLRALFAAGARQARGGEFTQRAFLNGRMDLIQAEAVIDLIDAETAEAARNAVGQISGSLSRLVNGIYDDIMGLVSRFYAVVDYPDEDIVDSSREDMLDTLHRAESDLTDLRATFSRGQLLKNGVPTVILGKPNAGKSSLLNALLGYDRAIVTDVAGTTRDTVEETVRIRHVLLRLVDTAGIHDTDDAIEQQGVARSRAAAQRASLALLVLDGSAPLDEADEAAIAVAETTANLLVVVNKADLPRQIDPGQLAERFDSVISLSAKTGQGIDVLTDAIAALYPAGAEAQGRLLTNARQADAVSRALEAVQSASSALRIGMTPDVVLTDVEAALSALGELNGKSVREDLVSTIFSRFCVGK